MKCRGCYAWFADTEDICPKCGRSTSKPIDRVSQKDVPAIAPTKKCMAYGCRLSGTFNSMIYGDTQNWTCFIHSEISVGEWQRATETINRRLPGLLSIPRISAFRGAMRDVVDGKEPSQNYWTADGVTHNPFVDEVRAAYAKSRGGAIPKASAYINIREPGEDREEDGATP